MNITCFNCLEYAKRCDVVFMRDVAQPYISNNKFSDITSGCRIYCWSSLLNQLFDYLKTTKLTNIILLSGDNDHSVNPNGCITSFPAENNVSVYMSGAPKNIKKWYAQNAQVVNDFMIPLPIGLSPPWVEFRVHKFDDIKQNKIKCDRSELVYINFGISTNPIQRTEIQNTIKNNISCDNYFGDHKKYYEDLQRFKYVICPPGNGKDTHRLWESLYFGAIPIVENNEMNNYFSKFFPILVVDRWSNITEDFLNKKYEEFKNDFDQKMLDVDVWFKNEGLI